jgi:septation ring formation regulator EzrA
MTNSSTSLISRISKIVDNCEKGEITYSEAEEAIFASVKELEALAKGDLKFNAKAFLAEFKGNLGGICPASLKHYHLV